MTELYHIEWTSPAIDDLDEIVNHIAQDSRAHALRIAERLEKRVRTLDESPHRGRIVPELACFGYTQYRELIERPWRIIYKIAGETVYILVLIDGRRNVQDLILAKVMRWGKEA
jgi:plasmid stabilization system protein ParE